MAGARHDRARCIPVLASLELAESYEFFYIRDPHGDLLRFGCAPQEIDPGRDERA